jgi:hypothetical protein
MYSYLPTHVQTYLLTCTCMYTHTHTHICTQIHIHIRSSPRKTDPGSLWLPWLLNECGWSFRDWFIYTYIYIYIHTYSHTCNIGKLFYYFFNVLVLLLLQFHPCCIFDWAAIRFQRLIFPNY